MKTRGKDYSSPSGSASSMLQVQEKIHNARSRGKRRGASSPSERQARPATKDICSTAGQLNDKKRRRDSILQDTVRTGSEESPSKKARKGPAEVRSSAKAQRRPKVTAVQKVAALQRQNEELARNIEASRACCKAVQQEGEEARREAQAERVKVKGLQCAISQFYEERIDLREQLTAKVQEVSSLRLHVRSLEAIIGHLRTNSNDMHRKMLNTDADLAEAQRAQAAAEGRANRLAAAGEKQELPLLPADAIRLSRSKPLGQGASGTVSQATLRLPVAVKSANLIAEASIMAPRDAAHRNRKYQAAVMYEATQLARFCGHPYIVQALGMMQEEGHLGPSIVLELASHGSLHRMMANNEFIDIDCQVAFAHCVADALRYIHDCGYSHGDIKPDNILTYEDDDGVYAKVTDLGLTAACNPATGRLIDPKRAGGTMGYLHPESYLDPAAAGQRDDHYAYGVTLLEMLIGRSAREVLVEQYETLPKKALDQITAEVRRRCCSWEMAPKDFEYACMAVAEAGGFISLAERYQENVQEELQAPDMYVQMVLSLVRIDPRSAPGPSWSEVLQTLDRVHTMVQC